MSSNDADEERTTGDVGEHFQVPRVDDVDLASNIAWNKQRWGQHAGWSAHDNYGYQWGKGHQQRTTDIAQLSDTHLRPFIDHRYDLNIVELSPGGGRFTVELLRYADCMTLVDLNEAAIDTCRERLKYYPTPIQYCINDGQSLPMVEDGSADLFACFDSMVHMHPEVIANYVKEGARVLSAGGIAWLDHSGRGERDSGHRTAMTAELMVDFAADSGLTVLDQRWRNEWDCISVLKKA